jgi:membrane-bound inhibitor of C-type lysozyme
MHRPIPSRTFALSGIAAALIVAGCQTPQPPPPPPPPPPPSVPATAEMRVAYSCSNGEQVAVRFFPQQGIGVLERGGQTVELQQQASPPGSLYVGAQTVLRVSEDRLRLTMTIGDSVATNCTAL